MRLSPRVNLLGFFAVLSLAAVLAGALICHLSGVAPTSWIRNVVAWGVGLLAATGLAFGTPRRPAPALIVLGVAVVALAAGFAGPAQETVHRWVQIGPLHVTIAFMVLPVAVVALALDARRWGWTAALAVLALLVAQPDASQATAFSAALIVIVWRGALRGKARIGLLAVAAALAVAAWFRPDPLLPVQEVEEIVALGVALSPALAAAAVALLLLTAAVPALSTQAAGGTAATAGLALSAYVLAAAAATVFGAFPMPLLGIGMSPILGVWLGVGLLAAALRHWRA